MRRTQFVPTLDAEARILLLIDAFSGKRRLTGSVDGRTKLAKLDFLLRYPTYLRDMLRIRNKQADLPDDTLESENLDTRMVRYRYGPWDPAYFAILGRLIGRGLVEPVSVKSGIGYRVTEAGREVARKISEEPEWQSTMKRAEILQKHLNLSGETLKSLVYRHFPEIADASWGTRL